MDLLEDLETSGLLREIHDGTVPDCIILYGSAARGEDTEQSDIDLFVQAKAVTVVLKRYEAALHRQINLFFEEDFARLTKELKNNILNGVKVQGYVKVF